jgi:hypothetical protein
VSTQYRKPKKALFKLTERVYEYAHLLTEERWLEKLSVKDQVTVLRIRREAQEIFSAHHYGREAAPLGPERWGEVVALMVRAGYPGSEKLSRDFRRFYPGVEVSDSSCEAEEPVALTVGEYTIQLSIVRKFSYLDRNLTPWVVRDEQGVVKQNCVSEEAAIQWAERKARRKKTK